MKKLLFSLVLLGCVAMAPTARAQVVGLNSFNRQHFLITTGGDVTNTIKVLLDPNQFNVTTNGITITNIGNATGGSTFITNIYSSNFYGDTIYVTNIFVTNLFTEIAYVTNLFTENFTTTNAYITFLVSSNSTSLNWQGTTNTLIMFGPDQFSGTDSIVTQNGTNSITINAPGDGFLTFGGSSATITATNGLTFSNGTSTIATIAASSGYTGTGTNVLKDDGSFGQWVGGSDGTNTTVVQLGPFTVDTYPVANATNTLTDGNLYRVGSTNVGISSHLVFLPGDTNHLYRSGGNLIYTNGNTTANGVSLEIVNGNANSALFGIDQDQMAYVRGGAGKFVRIEPNSGVQTFSFASTGFWPNQTNMLLGISTIPWGDFYEQGTYYNYGFLSGANYSRLAISHAGTNASTGGPVFDSQASGTAGIPRKFSFQSNSTEVVSISAAGATTFGNANGAQATVLVSPTNTYVFGTTYDGDGEYVMRAFPGSAFWQVDSLDGGGTQYLWRADATSTNTFRLFAKAGSQTVALMDVKGGANDPFFFDTVFANSSANNTHFRVANMQTNLFDVRATGALEAKQVATTPTAPAAGYGRFYFQDNGSGKMQFKVLFPTGAAQVIATEP